MFVKTLSLKDFNIGFIAQALVVGSSILILPLVLIKLSSEEVGLWFVFVSLGGLALLVELGFQPTISRFVSYAYAGIEFIEKSSVSVDKNSKDVNYDLLRKLFAISKITYLLLTGVVFLLLFVVGELYLKTLQLNSVNIESVILAWKLYALGFTINFYFGFNLAFLQGKGELTKANNALIVNRLSMVLFAYGFLILDIGLLGLGLASFLSSLIGRIVLYGYFKDTFENHLHNETSSKLDFGLLHKTALMSLKLGVVNISAFMITRISIFFVTSYLGLTVAASYGLTLQVFMTISALASTYFSLRTPLINLLQVSGDTSSIKNVFSQSICISFILYLFFSILVLLLGNYLLTILGSDTLLLSNELLIVIIVLYFLEMNHSLSAAFLMTFNEIKFMYPAIMSGSSIVFFVYLGFEVFHISILEVLLIQGGVQLLYNNWKWPLEAAKKLNIKYYEIVFFGFRQLLVVLIRRFSGRLS